MFVVSLVLKARTLERLILSGTGMNDFRHIVSHAVIVDLTDERAMKELSIRNLDHVIVADQDLPKLEPLYSENN